MITSVNRQKRTRKSDRVGEHFGTGKGQWESAGWETEVKFNTAPPTWRGRIVQREVGRERETREFFGTIISFGRKKTKYSNSLRRGKTKQHGGWWTHEWGKR